MRLMEQNELSDLEKLDIWMCDCGTYTPVKKGNPEPTCAFCMRRAAKCSCMCHKTGKKNPDYCFCSFEKCGLHDGEIKD
jgi:hypothetical protein